MSAIETYKAKLKELEDIKKIGRIDMVQMENAGGGLKNEIMIPNATALAVSAMLRFIYKNGEEFLLKMVAEAEAEVLEAEQAAVAEANQFISERL